MNRVSKKSFEKGEQVVTEQLDIQHIIVQAGGKGTRLEHLTTNKPKAIVPVDNLPMLFHLFRKFPTKRFIIIADYKKDVLREYLSAFAEVKYLVVDANGSGTCGGIRQATELLPDKEPFMLVWSDLILPSEFEMPAASNNYVGVSQTFPCRWKYENGEFREECSTTHGVGGLFIFKDKSYLNDIPNSGELVRFFKDKGGCFSELGLEGTREFGLLSEYDALGKEKCRPFNKMTVNNGVLVKEGIDEQGRSLAELEQNWYKHATSLGVDNIPKIYDTEPLKMEQINGRNIYEYSELATDKKRDILSKLVNALKQLHLIETVPADMFSLKDAYFGKTVSRLSKIRDLVPLADKPTITVNGRECRNVYFYKSDLERALDKLRPAKFAFIHGDCTFSNLMLKNDTEPIFIDPRGYFGHTKLYGDPNYDWAKLYYSLVGNYDMFNLKEFRLSICENSVELNVKSNKWESLEDDFFRLSGTDKRTIKLLHAVIWLSLTTYAWQDYDSICGAFYNGLYYLEEGM